MEPPGPGPSIRRAYGTRRDLNISYVSCYQQSAVLFSSSYLFSQGIGMGVLRSFHLPYSIYSRRALQQTKAVWLCWKGVKAHCTLSGPQLSSVRKKPGNLL